MEVDGAYFGGHAKPANENEKAERKDRRLAAEHQTGKRQVVVVMREREVPRRFPFVFRSRKASGRALKIAVKFVTPGSTVLHADEAAEVGPPACIGHS